MKLKQSFYTRGNVQQIARDLLGKELVTCFDKHLTSGIITETEAYEGETDRASHAFGGRRTKRTETMYAKGGVAYVYLCYGIHSLFNVVTNIENIPHAILIRAIYPLRGKDEIMKRRSSSIVKPEKICDGPGKVSMGLGIHYSVSGESLSGNSIWIEDKGLTIRQEMIQVSPRIGVEYAGEHALLPYRFYLNKVDVLKIAATAKF